MRDASRNPLRHFIHPLVGSFNARQIKVQQRVGMIDIRAAQHTFPMHHQMPPAAHIAVLQLGQPADHFFACIQIGQSGNVLTEGIKRKLFRAPTALRARDHPGQRKTGIVQMAKIAPVCIQQADRAIFPAIGSHACNVSIAVGDAVHEPVPSVDTGTHILHRAGLCQRAGGIRCLVGTVAPVQTDGTLGQTGKRVRMLYNDIAPEHGRSALLCHDIAELADKIDIIGALAHCGHGLPAPSPTQIKGLVGTNVEQAGGEQRHKLPQHSLHQRQSFRVGDIQRVVLHPVRHGGVHLTGRGQFCQMAIAAGVEQFEQMPETGQGWHQLHMPEAAVFIQFHDLLRRQWFTRAPQLRQIPEQVGMLNIQLQLIKLIKAGFIHQMPEPCQRRRAATGDIVIKAPVGKNRFICNRHCRKHASALTDDLAQGLNSIKQTRRIVARKRRIAGGDLQPVPLRASAENSQHNIPFAGFAAQDIQLKSRKLTDLGL